MSVLRTHGPRFAAAAVATLAVTGLTPLTAAHAGPADCATTLAPFLATSDAQPGYTGHATESLGFGTADATSAWDSRLVRSSLDAQLTLDLQVGGQTVHTSVRTASVATTRARWTTVPAELGNRRTRAGALALLHKSAPLWSVVVGRSTAGEVHASGVWPSHDAEQFLGTAVPVTDVAPGASGSTVYTCGDASLTATVTVTSGGLVSQMTLTSTSNAARATQGLVGSVRRAAASMRAAARGAARTAAPASDTITLDYTYARPVISVPNRAHVVELRTYRAALEAVDLRLSVHMAASFVALDANRSRTATHKRVTAGDVQRLARRIVGLVNPFQVIQWRAGLHPGSVWIAATNPFTGARVAYRVGVVRGTAKVTRIA
jgi:hypothetical protein